MCILRTFQWNILKAGHFTKIDKVKLEVSHFFISTTHFGGRVTGAYEKSKKLGSVKIGNKHHGA